MCVCFFLYPPSPSPPPPPPNTHTHTHTRAHTQTHAHHHPHASPPHHHLVLLGSLSLSLSVPRLRAIGARTNTTTGKRGTRTHSYTTTRAHTCTHYLHSLVEVHSLDLVHAVVQVPLVKKHVLRRNVAVQRKGKEARDWHAMQTVFVIIRKRSQKEPLHPEPPRKPDINQGVTTLLSRWAGKRE